jgi:hypothetical protein
MGYYAALSGISVLNFRYNLSVPSSRIEKSIYSCIYIYIYKFPHIFQWRNFYIMYKRLVTLFPSFLVPSLPHFIYLFIYSFIVLHFIYSVFIHVYFFLFLYVITQRFVHRTSHKTKFLHMSLSLVSFSVSPWLVILHLTASILLSSGLSIVRVSVSQSRILRGNLFLAFSWRFQTIVNLHFNYSFHLYFFV